MKPNIEPPRGISQITPRYYLILKRIFDIIGSLALIVVLAPCFSIISLIIKLTSPGPVFFKQIRLGQNGRDFASVKFRTMYIDIDERVHKEFIRKLIQQDEVDEKKKRTIFKLTADDRITPIGRFLRKTALDELPQLLNVLKGDMSFVGPRPLIRYEIEFWQENMDDLDIDPIKTRLRVKPGITGLWQICDKTEISFKEWIKIDLEYVKKQSFMLDLKILFKTIPAVMKGYAL